MCETRVNPGLQSQANEPGVFRHTELDGQTLPNAHSSMSIIHKN